MQAYCDQVLFCMKVQGGTLLIPIIYRTKKMPITLKIREFQMRAAFVALLASASLGAELGREARSMDMVRFLVLFVKVKFKILMLETVGHQIKVTWTWGLFSHVCLLSHCNFQDSFEKWCQKWQKRDKVIHSKV